MKNNNLPKAVISPRIFLCILFVVGSTVITTAAHSAKETAIHNQYLQNLQQCERQLAPAQCQRNANLKYKTEQYALKQQKIIQIQAIRALKIQQKTARPRLSQQQKLLKEINKRPLLQGSLPTSKAIILKRPRLIATKKYKYTQADTLLLKPIKVKLVDFKKRQADSNQKILHRLAKNNKRREQGFIVDTVIMP